MRGRPGRLALVDSQPMVVCPVCEHPQAHGAECELCGKRLVSGPAAIPRVAAVEGFEPTRLDFEDDPFDTVAALADLEPTLTAPVDVAEEATPGMEPTRFAPVDAEGDPVDGLERLDAAIPGDAPTAVPAAILCRYCRTPAAPGERRCERCGMRLPVFAEGDPAPEVSARGRCGGCGGLFAGTRCPSCGGRLLADEPR
jgi:hypothetical protein